MKGKNLSTMPIEELVNKYVELCSEQSAHRYEYDASGRLSVRTWNRLHDRIEAVHRELKNRGDAGVDALVALLGHDLRCVRYAAAVHTLRQRTDKALPVLEEMARSDDVPDPVIAPARTLRLWHSGRWVVD